ncbi:uncharacterized protein BXZ73DRAFT_38414 [Epithele typhae]|uniref:uncharacterized protein n=1 Tax=Epithele typhae TaxID=378194 RepID=UPI0020082268|nr:uncharacterized protein BXZ73DRAFT_38414 [Epithele typhae]KAH9945344.1 hypothetical protein BXZ73DRAFT_38414 [Epithele typhae]
MTLYLDSLQPLLPDDIRKQLDHALLPEIKTIVDTILRLAVGASAPRSCVLSGWEDLQPRAFRIMDDLKRGERPLPSQKRPREDDGSDSSDAKRSKTSDADAVSPAPPAADDPCVFALHGVSVTTPVRKKVTLAVHRASIRLTHPTTGKDEYPPIPLASLQRAFLLPTRGKPKPHWSVVLLSSDVPAPVPKGPASPATAAAAQLVFGLDATLPAPLATSAETHAKGAPSLPALRAFLAALPVPAAEPSAALFKSAVAAPPPGPDGVPAAGTGAGAYRGAKEGTLWFLDRGVLWDGKPCEFFALEHLAPAETHGGETVVQGVRTLSATGRTCSVLIRRVVQGQADKAKGKGKAEQEGDDGEESEDEVEVVEVDFGMVDGKEQEPIARWIKSRKHLFGRAAVEAPGGSSGPDANTKGKGKGKETAEAAKTHDEDPRAEDTEDEEDEDFTMSSDDEEDSGSESNEDSDASQDEQGDGDDGEGNTSDEETGDEAEAEGEDEDEVEELDPAHHPLLRPGAMPRMSKAAVDAVVGMVEQDMMGGGRRTAAADSEEEDEEDELDE